MVPGLVELIVELRHPDADELEAMLDDVLRLLDRVSGEHRVDIDSELIMAVRPTLFDSGVVSLVQAAANEAGLSVRRIASGAGHDAVPVSDVIPSGMIFVPCHDGVSHSETESMTAQWAANGAEVLLRAVLSAAQ